MSRLALPEEEAAPEDGPVAPWEEAPPDEPRDEEVSPDDPDGPELDSPDEDPPDDEEELSHRRYDGPLKVRGGSPRSRMAYSLS